MKTTEVSKRNFVAKHMNRFNKPKIERDRTKYSRKLKHQNKKAYQDVQTVHLDKPFFMSLVNSVLIQFQNMTKLDRVIKTHTK